MTDGPITIKAPEKKPINVRAGDLFSAIFAYLNQTHDMTVQKLTYAPDPEYRTTEITLQNLYIGGEHWNKGRYLFFTIDNALIRTEGSRIGSGPFVLEMRLTRDDEQIANNIPCEVFLDIVAAPNPDKSFTFYPVKKREDGLVHY